MMMMGDEDDYDLYDVDDMHSIIYKKENYLYVYIVLYETMKKKMC